MTITTTIQPHLCFDYNSSPDHDPELCNPSTSSFVFFPESLPGYLGPGASSAKDSTGQIYASTDNPQGLGSGLSNISTTQESFSEYASTSGPSIGQAMSLPSSPAKSCCKPAATSSTLSPSPSPSPAALATPCSGISTEGDMMAAVEGCGCAISPNMCCCGELCACPGCLAFPNNAINNPSTSMSSNSSMAPQVPFASSTLSAIPEPPVFSAPKGSCCGSKKNSTTTSTSTSTSTATSASFNHLSEALEVIRANSTFGANMSESEARQQVVNAASALAGIDASFRTQHPTLLGNDGVLICGCGCGRPTVDCSDCFRDMCQYVGETHARMMKDEFESEMMMTLGDDGTGGGSGTGGRNDLLCVGMNLSIGENGNRDMETEDMAMDIHLDSAEVVGNDGSKADQNYKSRDSGGGLTSNNRSDGNSNSNIQAIMPQIGQFSNAVAMQGQGQGQTSFEQRLRDAEEEQRIRLQQMEQEQMRLSQLQPATMSQLSQLQLDFLDDEDWSFVDEIRTDGLALPTMSGSQGFMAP
ncbi:hypothetical protein BGZ94_001508 [Podila epigama]|nr:hypothetical protein BGZ94_001508 [Podila epigama]